MKALKDQIKQEEEKLKKLETLKQQTVARLKLKQKQQQIKNDKKRTRGLIVLGGYVFNKYRHVLDEAIQSETKKDKVASLEHLKDGGY